MVKIGILTGGGDAPGLNAVIRATVIRLMRENKGYSTIGLVDGWAGLQRQRHSCPLDKAQQGRHRFFMRAAHHPGHPRARTRIRSLEDVQKAVDVYKKLELDALVAIGGDDTLEIAYYLHRDHGVNTVGVPKTIDNDVMGTDFTFGFWSSVEQAMRAIDDLRVTTMSHHRVMVIECMGRHAGWITAYTGLASEADYYRRCWKSRCTSTISRREVKH